MAEQTPSPSPTPNSRMRGHPGWGSRGSRGWLLRLSLIVGVVCLLAPVGVRAICEGDGGCRSLSVPTPGMVAGVDYESGRVGVTVWPDSTRIILALQAAAEAQGLPLSGVAGIDSIVVAYSISRIDSVEDFREGFLFRFAESADPAPIARALCALPYFDVVLCAVFGHTAVSPTAWGAAKATALQRLHRPAQGGVE